FFSTAAGNYTATYAVDDTPPTISSVAATAGFGNTGVITWTTDEPADSRVEYGTSAASLPGHVNNNSLVTSHNLTIAGLLPETASHYRVGAAGGGGNSAASPVFSFTMPTERFAQTDPSVAHFSAGTPDAQPPIPQTADGELQLAPAAGSEFFGASLPAD